MPIDITNVLAEVLKGQRNGAMDSLAQASAALHLTTKRATDLEASLAETQKKVLLLEEELDLFRDKRHAPKKASPK